MKIAFNHVAYFLPMLLKEDAELVVKIFNTYKKDFGIISLRDTTNFFAQFRREIKVNEKRKVYTRENLDIESSKLEKIGNTRNRINSDHLLREINELEGIERAKKVAYFLRAKRGDISNYEDYYLYRSIGAFDLYGKHNITFILQYVKQVSKEISFKDIGTMENYIILTMAFWGWFNLSECEKVNRISFYIDKRLSPYEIRRREETSNEFYNFLNNEFSNTTH